MRLFNTLTRDYREVRPSEPGRAITLYTCGPTVYDYAHIGNLKTFVVYDTLKRVLQYLGHEVKHAMNLTDIEDKIIATAGRKGISIRELTAPVTAAFRADLAAVNCLPIEEKFQPRATDFIPQQIAMIERLIAGGHAYAREGSVYFRIASFPDYGQLARIDLSGIQDGARIDNDEYDKESPRDFVLWKASAPGEAEVGASWPSPWGPGRPGWHLECSVMAHDLLGQPIDIHCGGVDLIFPHHTNEIAQSEAAYPDQKPFTRIWFHAEHLMVDGGKMSKSLGNFHTLKDLREKVPNFDPDALRFFYVSQHYRQSVNFTFEILEAAKAGLGRIANFRYRLEEPVEEIATDKLDFQTYREPQELLDAKAAFRAALADDLDTPKALTVVYELVSLANRKFDRREWGKKERDILRQFFTEDFQNVFGIDLFKKFPEASDPALTRAMTLNNERLAAKAAKDYAKADALRKEIDALGFIAEDTKTGSRLKRK